jgi:hypothetical protein
MFSLKVSWRRCKDTGQRTLKVGRANRHLRWAPLAVNQGLYRPLLTAAQSIETPIQ